MFFLLRFLVTPAFLEFYLLNFFHPATVDQVIGIVIECGTVNRRTQHLLACALNLHFASHYSAEEWLVLSLVVFILQQLRNEVGFPSLTYDQLLVKQFGFLFSATSSILPPV